MLITAFPAAAEGLDGLLEPYRFAVSVSGETSIIPYTDKDGRFVVYVCSEQPFPESLKLTAPGGKPGRAVICANTEATPYLKPF